MDEGCREDYFLEKAALIERVTNDFWADTPCIGTGSGGFAISTVSIDGGGEIFSCNIPELRRTFVIIVRNGFRLTCQKGWSTCEIFLHRPSFPPLSPFICKFFLSA